MGRALNSILDMPKRGRHTFLLLGIITTVRKATNTVAQADLKHAILLPHPPQRCDYRHVSLHPAWGMSF